MACIDTDRAKLRAVDPKTGREVPAAKSTRPSTSTCSVGVTATEKHAVAEVRIMLEANTSEVQIDRPLLSTGFRAALLRERVQRP